VWISRDDTLIARPAVTPVVSQVTEAVGVRATDVALLDTLAHAPRSQLNCTQRRQTTDSAQLSLASLRGRLIEYCSFGWGKGGNVSSAGWQVTLCDPMWHVSSRSGVATLRTAIHLLLTYLLPVSCRNDSEIRLVYGVLFERVAAYRPRQTILTTRRIDEERTQNSPFPVESAKYPAVIAHN